MWRLAVISVAACASILLLLARIGDRKLRAQRLKLLNKMFLVLIALIAIGAANMLLQVKDLAVSHYSPSLEQKFYDELAKSKGLLDLRKIDTLTWDEIIFWPPYQSICDFEIEGYRKGSAACEQSKDDGECYLLFLQKNSLVGKIRIDRKKFDLTKANLKGRIPKEKAVFIFQAETAWPIVKWAE